MNGFCLFSNCVRKKLYNFESTNNNECNEKEHIATHQQCSLPVLKKRNFFWRLSNEMAMDLQHSRGGSCKVDTTVSRADSSEALPTDQTVETAIFMLV